MTRQEFEVLAGVVSEESFKAINFVYTFHPAIDEVRGKQQIADLFKTFGMRVIHDMIRTAEDAKVLEEKIQAKTRELDALRNEFAVLRMV